MSEMAGYYLAVGDVMRALGRMKAAATPSQKEVLKAVADVVSTLEYEESETKESIDGAVA